jgi:hypothetical protein
MSKRDEQAEIEGAERALRALGDTLRRAAKNADALDLKPEVKAWLLDQFGPNKPRAIQPVTDEKLENVRDIVRQQSELEQQARPTSGKSRHAETEQQRRKSKQKGDDLPPH